MKHMILTLLLLSGLMADNFTLNSNDLKGQLTKVQEFNSFGCSGENKSPHLQWSNVPKGTKSFAITVYDPDAPTGSGWWHWLVVNIPVTTNSIITDASNTKKLPKGAIETVNDYGSLNFGGACPPKADKAHSYVFTVYALDVEKLEVTEKSDSALVGYMINQHLIQKATMVSYYQR
ncbi:MAG: Phospholipid-binding protein [uncultured Sulfurovum sp.]|uniref:Phospholipid-binding protein n=1 Tax=uncultured Sulfurovum sp. TaxID=269237 RepID=A0A6S6SYK3_9BACT|nr:MAG: Phospholipid-binding protein [uncultured Sulfurovum sp.]